MSENDKDIEIDVKGEVTKENVDKGPQKQTKENGENNSLPDIEELEENEDSDSNENEGSKDGSDEGDKDSEENEEESDDEESNDDESSDDGESKEDSENPGDNNEDRYNNNRKNLNPKRNEQSQSAPKDNSNDKGGKGKVAGKAKEALANKVAGGETAMKAKKAIDTTTRAATAAANAGHTFFHLIVNPITWIVLALAVVFIYTISFSQSVGQNDYNIVCDSSGVGAVDIDPSADAFTRQSAIASWLTSTPFEITGGQPLSREQAAGILGNLMSESYGANPKAIQGDASITLWEKTDNDDVLSWGTVGGKAIGIIQWDTGRRIGLVNFAKSEGTQWHNLTTQLKFLKKEMESGYERDQLVSGGFNQQGKSVAEYTKIWNVYFERSAASGTPEGDNPRIANAEGFAKAYTGGSVSIGGLSSNCLGGSFAGAGIDTTSVVQLAIQAAHPRRRDALENCGNNLTNCGQNTATDAYKKAKVAAEAATSKDPIRGLLASCDRFVATMYRATGADPSFPWGSSDTQIAYLRKSPKWEQTSCQDRQPGDILWRDGHTMLYVGLVNGTDSIASASLAHRSGNLSKMSCQGDTFIADADTAIGFRKVD